MCKLHIVQGRVELRNSTCGARPSPTPGHRDQRREMVRLRSSHMLPNPRSALIPCYILWYGLGSVVGGAGSLSADISTPHTTVAGAIVANRLAVAGIAG